MGKTNYLIHTCGKRKWYVDEYLVPSMKKQGIKNIKIYNDDKGEGQLQALLNSYPYTNGEDTWHLQDDIIISSKFKEVTESFKDGEIACGFCNSFSDGYPGYANMWSMWYSMPCVRIPGHIFKEFIDWMKKAETQKRLYHYYSENKHDDVFLEIFLKEHYPRMRVWNIAPNIVNHIDHLIGGSLINKDRNKEPKDLMAKYWNEPDLLADIESRLKHLA